MRQRLAIWFVLPCLCLAWPSFRSSCAGASAAGPPIPRRGRPQRRRTAAQPPGAGQPAARATGRRSRRPPQPMRPRRPKPPHRAPAAKLDKWNDAHSDPARLKSRSSPGPSCLLIWLLFLIWVKSADWINHDTQIFDLGYGKWNPIVFFPFLAILLLFAFPILVGFANFWVAFGLLFVCYLATLHSVRADAQ